jgi:Xaa-Pro dipeptidase
MKLWCADRQRLSLVDVVKAGATSTASPLPSGKYPAREHIRKVLAELGVDDGLIYLPGEPTRIYEDSDMGPRLRQRRYFFYITGADIADCKVTYDIRQGKLILWIPYVEPRQVLWYGRGVTAAEAKQLYDVDDVRYTTQLSQFLNERLNEPGAPTLYILHPEQAPGISLVASGTAQVDFTSLQPAMDRARVVKTDHEVALIRRANDISSAAHRAVAEHLLGMTNEQDIEAVFRAACVSRGAHLLAYPTIAGAGVNASSLHYGANDQPLAGKQLVVVDAGCEYSCYASDITRTLPVPGAFSAEGAAIYRLVEEIQRACISRVRPGLLYYRLHILAHMLVTKGLAELGILRGDRKAMAAAGTSAAFFPHGLGHHMGLDCHDVNGADRLLISSDVVHGAKKRRDFVSAEDLVTMKKVDAQKVAGQKVSYQANSRPYNGRQLLQPNMVVTIEPGIYFCREYIEGYFLNDLVHSKFIDREVLERYYDVGGVRIEDDILVTNNGYENLTSAPKSTELLDIISDGFEHV